MSLEAPEPRVEPAVGHTADGLDYDALADLVGEDLLGREEHVNAPAFVIRPDAVRDVLGRLKNDAGFDHLACVTAQEYGDRYESIYHLRTYDDPTKELGIVVPTSKDEPVSESADPVYRTADWHER